MKKEYRQGQRDITRQGSENNTGFPKSNQLSEIKTMTIERGQIEKATSKLLQRLLLTSKDIKRTSMQMPHAFSERKSSTSIRGGLKVGMAELNLGTEV